jgi:hypothetical protein
LHDSRHVSKNGSHGGKRRDPLLPVLPSVHEEASACAGYAVFCFSFSAWSPLFRPENLAGGHHVENEKTINPVAKRLKDNEAVV